MFQSTSFEDFSFENTYSDNFNKVKHFTLIQLHYDASVIFCSPPSDHVAFVYCILCIHNYYSCTNDQRQDQTTGHSGLTGQKWGVGFTTEHQVHQLLFFPCVVFHSGG